MLVFAAFCAPCAGHAGDSASIRDGVFTAEQARRGEIAYTGPCDGGGFGLAVKLRVEDRSLPQAELEALAREAHEKICPYSHATRGNVNVQLEVVGS